MNRLETLSAQVFQAFSLIEQEKPAYLGAKPLDKLAQAFSLRLKKSKML